MYYQPPQYYQQNGMGAVARAHPHPFPRPRPYFYPQQQVYYYPQPQYQPPTECPPVAQGVTTQVPGQQLAALASGQVQSLKVVGIDSYGRGVTITILAHGVVAGPPSGGMQGYGPSPVFAAPRRYYEPAMPAPQAYDAPMGYSDPLMDDEQYPYSELPVG